MDNSGGLRQIDRIDQAPIWVETATGFPEASRAVAVMVYLPSGHCVPSLPLPSQAKAWLSPAVTG